MNMFLYDLCCVVRFIENHGWIMNVLGLLVRMVCLILISGRICSSWFDEDEATVVKTLKICPEPWNRVWLLLLVLFAWNSTVWFPWAYCCLPPHRAMRTVSLKSLHNYHYATGPIYLINHVLIHLFVSMIISLCYSILQKS